MDAFKKRFSTLLDKWRYYTDIRKICNPEDCSI